MAKTDDLLAAIESIHVAGLDAEHWPKALAATARLLGGSAATLEIYGRRGLLEWHGVGIPPAEQLDYIEHYAAINPRANFGLRMQAAELLWDYQILDEAAMDRDPYYSELLPRTHFRYFLSGRLMRTAHETAFATVQRTRAQGHVTPADIQLMGRLVPHFRQARDVAIRLGRAAGVGRSLEGALDWLADGVALVREDGTIVYANDALRANATRGDGLRITKGAFVFQASEARARFATAMAAVARLRAGDAASAGATDLAVGRSAGMPPYLLSVRPLPRGGRNGGIDGRAAAIVFIRDPLNRGPAASALLREVFGFTEAEANLARALQCGASVAQYARERVVSLNTIYTHLRRIKEKTGCKRMGELIHKLNELQVSLRSD